MKLVVFKEVATRIPATRIRRLFRMITTAEAKGGRRSHVNLIVAGDRRLRELNRKYRRRDRTTDVLSFNLDPLDEPGGVFGEIYISAARAIRQAREYQTSVADEFLRLFCHGLLHLFGYDHHKARQAARMQRRQDSFLDRLERSVR